MATDFKSFIEQYRDVGLFAYCHIQGIPHVFSNLPVMPDLWTMATGETWSPTLTWFRGDMQSAFESVSQVCDLKEGMPNSGSCELEFSINPNDSADIWQNLLAPTTRYTWSMKPGEAPIFPSDSPASITLLDATGLNVGDYIHNGLECLEAHAIAGTVITQALRGQFDSPHKHMGPRDWSEIHSGGLVEFTSWPKTWKGRVVEVYLAVCWQPTQVGGRLVPIDVTMAGPYSRMIFRGVLAGPVFGSDHCSVRFTAQTIDQVLERPLSTRIRRYHFGPAVWSTPLGWMVVEEAGPALVEYDAGEMGSGIINLVTGGWITAGVHGAHEVSSAICAALADAVALGAGDTFQITGYSVQATIDAEHHWAFNVQCRDGGVKAELIFLTGGPALVLKFKTSTEPQKSVLPCLGFTEDCVIGPGSNYMNHQHVTISQDPVPDYYLALSNTLVAWHHPEILAEGTYTAQFSDPPQAQGTTKADGVADGSYLRIGTKGEVIEVAMRTGGGAWQTTAPILSRGNAGCVAAPVIVPQGQTASADWELVLGLCFPNHTLMSVLRWLACSTGDTAYPASTWNVLNYGFGAGIDPDFIDHDSFDEIENSMSLPCKGWWIEGEKTMREIFAAVAKAHAISFIPRYGSTGFCVGVHNLLGASTWDERSNSDNVVIDADWTVSVDNPAVPDWTELDVVNRITFKYGLRPDGTWVGEDSNGINDLASIENYGPTEPMAIEFPWIAATEGDQASTLIYALVLQMGSTWLGYHASPHPRVKVPVDNFESWCIQTGDIVLLTHSKIMDMENGGTGMVRLPLEVESKIDSYGPGSDTTSELTLRVPTKATRYCLNLKLIADLGGFKYTCEQHEYSDAGGTVEDLDAWEEAAIDPWAVAIALSYDYATRVTRLVMDIDLVNHAITFDAALSAAILADLGNAIVSFDVMSAAVVDEVYHAFLADDVLLTTTGPGAVEFKGARWR
jgi:hypothetical protein